MCVPPSASRRQSDRAWDSKPRPLWLPLERNAEQAYATIVTGSAAGYIVGAMVTAASITMMDASRDMVAIVTDLVDANSREMLRLARGRHTDIRA